jgi:MFS transporter, DHA1 family, multidrug resistance protein
VELDSLPRLGKADAFHDQLILCHYRLAGVARLAGARSAPDSWDAVDWKAADTELFPDLWRAVFVVLAGVGAVFLAGALVVVPETNVHAGPRPPRADDEPSRLARLLADRAFLGYVAVMALMFSGQFAFTGSSFALIVVLGVFPDVYGLCFGSRRHRAHAGQLSLRAAHAACRHRAHDRGGHRLRRDGERGAGGAALARGGHGTNGDRADVLLRARLGLVLPNAMAGAMAAYPRMAGTAAAVAGFV